MKIVFEIVDSNKTIQENILQALLPDVVDFMDKIIQRIQSEFPLIIRQAIIDTPEYSSILNGQLKYEFGLPDSSSKLSGLLDIWSTNLNYAYKKPNISNGRIVSSFSVSALRIDFSDVLYTDYATMYDTLRGYRLPWLEWLVLEGNRTIIDNHEIVFGPSRYSRTGNAIMKKSPQSWSVPSEFAGDISNNWITRALENIQPEIQNTLDRIFQ